MRLRGSRASMLVRASACMHAHACIWYARLCMCVYTCLQIETKCLMKPKPKMLVHVGARDIKEAGDSFVGSCEAAWRFVSRTSEHGGCIPGANISCARACPCVCACACADKEIARLEGRKDQLILRLNQEEREIKALKHEVNVKHLARYVQGSSWAVESLLYCTDVEEMQWTGMQT